MRFIRTAENLFGLPLGFTRVEYLQSTGTQYIDTGVIGNGEFDVDYIYYQTQDTANAIFAGTRSSSQHLNFGQRSNGSSGGFSMAYLGDYWQAISSPAINTKIRVQISYKSGSQTGYLNGVAMTGKTLVGTEETNLSIYLFKRNHYGTDNVSGLVGRIYYFKLWKDGALVRDFIPCIDSLGVACMYDLVGKKPYYNQGTGTFTTGRQVIPVEYLEASGTQYIDTGFMPNQDTKIDLIGKFDTNYPTCLYATRWAQSPTYDTYGCYAESANLYTYYGRFSDNQFIGVNISEFDYRNTYINFVQDKNVSTYTRLDGEDSWTYTFNIATFQSTRTLTLFYFSSATAFNTKGGTIKSCKIYDNDVLVRDFIPCKDENNVGFMFDTVSGTAYLNAGTGSFSVGENKYTSKLRLIKDAVLLPDGYKRVEYLESTGTQYIDTECTINTSTDEVETYFQLITTDKYKWLMGEHDNGARFGIGSGDGTNLRNIAYGASTYKVNDTEVYNSQHYFNANTNGVYVNGTQVKTFESFTSASTIYLFNLNISGGGNGAAGKIWRYVQKRNGVLIRDMIPCIDPNNTPCMFDLVDGKPYYNQGTGSFTYGHTITPIEYLESTGTQYIDTGYTSNNIYANSACEVICETSDLSNRVVGCGGLSDNNKNISLSFSGGGYIVGLYGNRWTSDIFAYSTNTKYKIKFEVSTSQQKLYVNDNLIDTTTYSWESSNNYPLRLFKTNADTYTKPTKIYGFKLWISGSLVKDLIPVKDENNVGYMFDEVTGQLFGNAGTGSFGIGNDLTKPKVRFIQDVIPSAYLPLKYLESTGTQYIDTGFKMSNNNMTFEGNMMWTQSQGSANFFYGYRSVNSAEYRGDMRAFFIYGASPAGRLAIRYGVNTDNSTSVAVSLNTKFKIAFDGTNLNVNGTTYSTLTQAYTPANYKNMWLFNCNTTGYYSADVNHFIGRIYNWQIKQDGVLVRDLYPALRKSDNKPGMYDRITKQFFVNQGTGEFNYG